MSTSSRVAGVSPGGKSSNWFRRAEGRAPVVCGHRGTPAHAPENTIAGFRRAHELGATAIEFDVRPTRDGTFVVHHDPMTSEDILICDASRADLRPDIPTLAELVDACPDLLLDIELKTDVTGLSPDEYAARALDEIQATCGGRLDRVIVTSFDEVVLAIVAADASVATGLLYHDRSHAWAVERAVTRGHQAIAPWIELLEGADGGDVVNDAHDAGLGVLTWTVNSTAQIERARATGVDVIIGDDPIPLLTTTAG